MKLYEQFAQTGYHTSLVTSFGIDFDAYESAVLGRLRGAGCNNNLLVVDRGMLCLALEEGGQLPRDAGRTYTVTSARTEGVFHPKVVLQIGRDSARLIVGSANMTSAGLAGNLEVVGTVETKDPSSVEARIIAAAWSFVSSFLDRDDEGIDAQIRWMLSRSPWLSKIEPPEAPLRLSDNHLAMFIASSSDPIGRRFEALIGDQKVRRLIVVSPYWDGDLSALNRFLENLKPESVFILLDRDRHIFRPAAIAEDYKTKVKLLGFYGKKDQFIHAKIIIAETDGGDFVLYGSANCTTAALGRASAGGINTEACLYRSLPAGTAVDNLDLARFLGGEPIDHKDYYVIQAPPELPLDVIAARFPGQFSCKFDRLIWVPPPSADPSVDKIELLSSTGVPLSIELRRTASNDARRIQFMLAGEEKPAFARVRRKDGTLSSIAIVTVLDDLRNAMKDPRSRQIDAALAKLDGEADMGLWLLDVLGELETALANQRRSVAPHVLAKAREREAEVVSARILTYDEFMAGRRLQSELGGASRDGLSGTEFSSFRSYLNRFLSIDEPPEAEANQDFDATNAFDLGDETADAEAALDQGQEFSGTAPHTRTPASPAAKERYDTWVATRRRGNQGELICAVEELLKMVRTKAHDDGLSVVDMLRLRAFLMILAAAGWRDTLLPARSWHVLPATGDIATAWPRLMGKVLFAYFGGTSPAIHKLKLDSFFDQLSDDILECLGTCIWAIHAAIDGAMRHKDVGAANSLELLAKSIYRIVLLQPDDMNDPRIIRTIDALSARFARNLNPSAETIRAMHAATTAAVFANKQASAGSVSHQNNKHSKIVSISSTGNRRQ
ncbi:hypothetical protein [Methylobacterium sp. 1030]|uniref:hypothetical protein n=1 Tax=Methylobacterium sp. 1030 TaxID=3156404 RepID=UPI003390CF49